MPGASAIFYDLMTFFKIFGTLLTIIILWTLIETARSDRSLPLHKRLWKSWLAVGHRIGTFNSRVILTVFYFLVIMPYAVAMRLFGDPLHLKHKGWHSRTTKDLTLKDVSRQF